MSQELQGLLDLHGGALTGLNGLPTRQPLPRQAATSIEAHSTPTEALATARRILLWDLPTRFFHWSLVASVSTAIATGLAGGNWMVWHGRAGIAIAGLLAFRIVWGFVGGKHARFKSFVPGPAQVLAYLRGRWRGLGHNPLGALSVLALLGLLTAQVFTGLVGNDEIAFSGPWVSLVDEAQSLRLTGLHHSLANVLIAWIGLHLLAMLFHRLVKKDDLIRPMLSGYKKTAALESFNTPPQEASAGIHWLKRSLALGLALSAGLATAYLAQGDWLQEAQAESNRGDSGEAPSSESAPPPAAKSNTPAW